MYRIRMHMKAYAVIFILLIASALVFSGAAAATEATHGGGSESTQESAHGAAGGGGEAGAHGGGDRTGDYLDLLARALNFTAMVIILFIVIKKSNAFGFFSTRIEEIKAKMESLKQEKEESESKYRDIEKKLKAFEEERKSIIEQARQDGLSEKEKIIAEAKERVKQILDQAERNIQHEMQAAKNTLRKEVVDLAAQKAREMIASGMKDDDQDRLVDDFIERVGKIH